MRKYTYLAALLIFVAFLSGCGYSEQYDRRTVSNNDIGKIADLNNTMYYVDNGRLYESILGENKNDKGLMNVYSLQTVDGSVYAAAYDNGDNCVYDITGEGDVVYEFKTEDIPEKFMIDMHGCCYLAEGRLDFAPISENDIFFDDLSNVYEFTITDEGIYCLVFTGEIGDQSELFADINSLSIVSELWFYGFDGGKNLVKAFEGFGGYLSCYGNGVIYRCDDQIHIADKNGSKCVVENVLPISIVVYNNKIYFSDLSSSSIKEYSIENKTIKEIGEYADLLGVANNNIVKEDFSMIDIHDAK